VRYRSGSLKALVKFGSCYGSGFGDCYGDGYGDGYGYYYGDGYGSGEEEIATAGGTVIEI
jgi:hypothetical protein